MMCRIKSRLRIVVAVALLSMTAMLLTLAEAGRMPREHPSNESFLGFDRNQYPGDTYLTALRRTFSFAGYWLNNPPNTNANSWVGKRKIMRTAGFGFLLLFNGRLDAEIKKEASASDLGRADAEAAVTAAEREGFPKGSVIFLDQEEGGAMLPEQKAYIYSWVDGVNHAEFRAGIYCSGIAVSAGQASVVTANDIRENAGGRSIEFWVAEDSCPPSPGCSFQEPPLPSDSGTQFATAWQYAQSPRRRDFARACKNYASDGFCYPPELAQEKIFVDLDTATTADPSHGR
jgi:hypothetical protein